MSKGNRLAVTPSMKSQEHSHGLTRDTASYPMDTGTSTRTYCHIGVGNVSPRGPRSQTHLSMAADSRDSLSVLYDDPYAHTGTQSQRVILLPTGVWHSPGHQQYRQCHRNPDIHRHAV